MSSANPLWGAPRIVGELAKIGIDLPQSTVAKYMVRRRRPPSTTWRAFLKNHIRDIVATDFFVVPTVRNQILFVFLVLAHERRRILHFNVTAYPTAEWAAQQIVEAFPWTDPPKYLLRDRDGIYGMAFRNRVTGLGMKEVLIAPQSPWQNPFVERLIGVATQSSSGAFAVKSRSTRSGAASAPESRSVVLTNFRRLTPTKPAPRIRRATRLRPTSIPLATRSAWIRGAP
jgi:hypothetical protein